ncbi:MAG: DinB family protein [Flavobacteriales bacterium]|jgi:uncharacterized damage-inducible protein DinB|nr:DinB family protein [Flavobacteriales bacterium]
MKPLIEQFADYTLWANSRFVERLSEEPDTILDKPVANSFPSLRATLMHIRNAENTWRCRLDGVASAWPAETDDSLGTVLTYTRSLHEKVRAMSEHELLSEITYKDLRGNAHTQPAWYMVMHCCNHGTQHRGQLITMMRALELSDIPANDLVVYQRSL